MKALVFCIVLSTIRTSCLAEVIGTNTLNQTTLFPDMEAEFGTSIDSSITGVLMYAEPLDGCSVMKERPYPTRNDNISVNAFALIIRGKCDFAQKVFNAQNANYDGVIVFNNDSDELLRMASNKGAIAKQITIPSVFVGSTSGYILNSSFLYFMRNSPYITITAGFSPYSFKYYIVPFVTVIGSCFLALLLFMGVRYFRDRRRQRRNRLSRQRLKKLPVKQYEKSDEYDVCAICLDDYEVGDRLRILPCQHAYHCKCVDPWLTTNKRVCPLCKQKVLSDDESSNSDTDYSDSDSEHAPLLQNSAASSPNAARFATGFSSQNPILRSYSASTVSTTAASIENESFPDEETPHSSMLNLHGQVHSPSGTPIFHSVPESEPVQEMTLTPDASPSIAVVPVTHSDDEYSCRSSPVEDSEISSYRDAEEVFVVSGAFQTPPEDLSDESKPLV